MMKKKQRIVIFGLGSIGSRHARLLSENFSCDLVAFRKNTSLSHPLGIPEVHTWAELEKWAPDIAFVTNPTSMHVATAKRCAQKGWHLFIEKPLAHRWPGCAELQKICEKKKLVNYVACQLRFDPIIEHLKKISLKKYTEAIVTCSSYMPNWQKGDYRKSFRAFRKMGGGVLLDLIHEPDYCAYLFGRVEGIRGEAGKKSRLKIETEDYVDIELAHQGGTKSFVHLDYYGKTEKRTIELIGKNRSLRADLRGRTVVTKVGDRRVVKKFPLKDKDQVYLKQLRYFFRCITKREKPMNNIREHLELLQPLLEFKKTQNI